MIGQFQYINSVSCCLTSTLSNIMTEQSDRYFKQLILLDVITLGDDPLFNVSWLLLLLRSFQSIEEELDFYRSRAESLEGTLLDTQLALEEFQASSRELEEEMEKELERTEKINSEVKSRNETLRKEAEEWKVRKLPFPLFAQHRIK